jgi:hypothetical protein
MEKKQYPDPQWRESSLLSENTINSSTSIPFPIEWKETRVHKVCSFAVGVVCRSSPGFAFAGNIVIVESVKCQRPRR